MELASGRLLEGLRLQRMYLEGPLDHLLALLDLVPFQSQPIHPLLGHRRLLQLLISGHTPLLQPLPLEHLVWAHTTWERPDSQAPTMQDPAMPSSATRA